MRYWCILLIGSLLCGQLAARQACKKKPWTVLVYMAADNDLYPFVALNIEQMKQVGSSENVTILVHLDVNRPQTGKTTERYVIEQHHTVPCHTSCRAMDSGAEETLYDAMQWAIESYPSEHFGVIFWNHGSGDVNAFGGIDVSALFSYNAATRSLDFDQAAAPMSLFTQPHAQCRRICYDESSLNFLDDGKIKRVFDAIGEQYQKKIDIVMFDACFMAGIGTVALLYPYVDYMVGSEEVVLGLGYNYRLVFQALAEQNMTPKEMAQHVVHVYEKMYRPVTNRYTHSALQLSHSPALLHAINECAVLLCRLCQYEGDDIVNRIIKEKLYDTCIYFGDGSCYVDLADFVSHLRKYIDVDNVSEDAHLIAYDLVCCLDAIQEALHAVVVANVVGDDVASAGGVSLYLPKEQVHASFLMSEFGLHNTWHDFLLLHVHG